MFPFALEDPPVIVSQLALLVAVQGTFANTLMVPRPPPQLYLADVGVRVTLWAPAAWVTVSVWPAMVKVPTRLDPVLA